MDSNLSSRCLSLDLEVGKQDRRIHAFAAVRPDVDQPLVFQGGDLAAALAELDEFADGADFLLGHNLIDFDLPHLKAAKPDLRLLKLLAVDTLRLNPLAFPRNPYHHLVKHYQDGQLKRGRLNDPELDARLALDVFDDQQTALRDAPRGLLAAWHWLTGTGPDGAGFDAVFDAIRSKLRPTDAAANAKEKNPRAACGHRLPESRSGYSRECRPKWLAAGLHAGLAVSFRWQFRDAAVGPTSVSRSR